jgi:hypothetical protein
MLILLIVDIIAILGTIYLAFSRLLASNPLIFWFVVASIIFTVLLVVYSYFAFADIVKERDQLKAKGNNTSSNGIVVLRQPSELFITIANSNFGLSGDSGYPLVAANGIKSRWIRLGIVFEGNVYIETLELVISGKQPISAFEWEPGRGAYFFYFQIPTWVKSGENRTIQVIAFANGKKWGSEEHTVSFPI